MIIHADVALPIRTKWALQVIDLTGWESAAVVYILDYVDV